MATVRFDQRFSPAEATRGSYVPIELQSLTACGSVNWSSLSGSRGKYAVLTYPIGNCSGSPLYTIVNNPTNNPVPVNLVNSIVISSVEVDVSGVKFVADIETVDHILNPVSSIVIQSVPISTISITIPNQIEVKSENTFTNVASVLNFVADTNILEIRNNDGTNIAYVMCSATSFDTLTAKGMPINPGEYYSLERKISTITVGANGTNTDLRIMGHYR